MSNHLDSEKKTRLQRVSESFKSRKRPPTVRGEKDEEVEQVTESAEPDENSLAGRITKGLRSFKKQFSKE